MSDATTQQGSAFAVLKSASIIFLLLLPAVLIVGLAFGVAVTPQNREMVYEIPERSSQTTEVDLDIPELTPPGMYVNMGGGMGANMSGGVCFVMGGVGCLG